MSDQIIDPLYYDLVLRETIMKLIRYVINEDKSNWLELVDTLTGLNQQIDARLIELTVLRNSMMTELSDMRTTHQQMIDILTQIQTERLNGL